MPDAEQSRNALCCSFYSFEGWLLVRAPVKVECVAGASYSCTWEGGAPWTGVHGGCSESVSNAVFLLILGCCSLEELCLQWKVLCGILVKYFFSKYFSLGKLSRQILPQNSQGFIYSLIYTIKTVLIS